MESVRRFAVLWLGVAMIAGVVAAPAVADGGPHSLSAAKKCKKKRAASSRKRKCKKKQATQPPAPAPAPGVAPPVVVTPPVDVTPPDVRITQPANGAVTGPSGTVIYSTGDSAYVRCTLDGNDGFCDLSGMFPFSGLSDGTHTFALTGYDAAGNSALFAVTWNVDAVGPTVVITNPTNGGHTGSSGSVTYTVGDSDSVECALDGGSPVSCNLSGTFSFSGLGNGTHTFMIFGVDQYGNQGATANVMWNVP